MKEIKFRAWDKVNKIMHLYVQKINFHLSDDGTVAIDSMEVGDPPTGHVKVVENPGEFETMQYTGLKDKNGMEIFEGDILDYFPEQLRISVLWDMSGANWQFDDYGTFDDGVGRGEWDFTIGVANNSEIIGNIYENPELLNQ